MDELINQLTVSALVCIYVTRTTVVESINIEKCGPSPNTIAIHKSILLLHLF